MFVFAFTAMPRRSNDREVITSYSTETVSSAQTIHSNQDAPFRLIPFAHVYSHYIFSKFLYNLCFPEFQSTFLFSCPDLQDSKLTLTILLVSLISTWLGLSFKLKYLFFNLNFPLHNAWMAGSRVAVLL